MFSFFRKSRKESKPEPQVTIPADDEEERKLTEASKKKTKNEKKPNKDKKVSFKVEPEPVTLPDDAILMSPSNFGQKDCEHPPVAVPIHENKVSVLPINTVVSDSSYETDAIPFQMGNGIFQQEDPPDVFCEAQEALQPEHFCPLPNVSTQSSQPSATVLISEIVNQVNGASSPHNSGDKQPQSLTDPINRESVVSSDVGDVNPKVPRRPDTCTLPIMVEQRGYPEIPPKASFLSEETATSHETPNVQKEAKMTTSEDDQVEVLSMMEEQVRQLEMELREKNQRVEQLEALLADDDRLSQLETLERLEAEWNKERELVDNEREEELRLLQEALEEALEEKAEIESKMLRDASRESQLLDDFEWKLGEIEREYKKKLAEVEKATEERVKKEMAAENQQLLEDKRDIDEKLAEIAHLKSYEAEVSQLRGLIHEQQRAIRVAARQVDQLRVTERLLQDDLNKIRTQGCTRKQQQEMEEKWEEKTLTECNRLRAELLATNEEEMLKAIRQVVHEKDDQITTLKRQFEAQQLALNHQMTELKNSFQQREAKLNKQIEATQAAADRELCDMRRQLNKVQDSHAEALEQVERKHAEEIERCGTFTNESKEILEQTYEEKLQSIEIQHQSQLNALQSLIEEEKQEALTQLGEHYQNQLQSLQEHISDLQKRVSDANKLTSQKQEEIRILQEIITQQEQQLEVLQNHSEEQQRSNAESTSCRRRSSEDSSTAETESSGDEDDESTPPNGRSAGDGCSPSTSAATSQDNLRPELSGTLSSMRPVLATHLPGSSEKCIPIQIEHLEQVQSGINGCDDPEHAEAQQIILEMHQVLADRDAELQRLTEEKRFYQLELIHWERNLALQRVGLPLALVPDRLSNDSELNPWRGYSAPPVTKPRLPDSLQLSSAAAFAGSRAASYELFSPSATSLSPDCGRQLFPNEHPSNLLPPGDWVPAMASDERQMHWPAQQGSHFYYSDDDDDSNNNGFTTPL